MNKNGERLNERREFVKDCIDANELTYSEFEKKVEKLKEAKSVTQKVTVLSDILYLSEMTIYRDYSEK